MKEHLAESTLLTGALTWQTDDDGNMQISQDGESIIMTPTQQRDLLSLLESNLDVLKYVWGKT